MIELSGILRRGTAVVRPSGVIDVSGYELTGDKRRGGKSEVIIRRSDLEAAKAAKRADQLQIIEAATWVTVLEA